MTNQGNNPHLHPSKGEITISEIIQIAWSGRKRIVSSIGGAIGIAAIVAMLLPNIYTAETVILPPQQQQSAAAAMLSQLGGLAGGAGAALGIKNPNDTYVSMILSKSVADILIAKYRLKEYYKTENRDNTIIALSKVTDVTSGKDGLISIKVEDKDPKIAAQLANAYVAALKQVNSAIAVSSAAQRRLFYGEQLKKAKNSLVDAENKLASVQKKTGVVELNAQGQVTIEAVAQLRAQIAAKEVLVVSLRQAMTESNPELAREKAALSGLRSQLAKLLSGSNIDGESSLSVSAAPAVGLEYIRAFREVKYGEALMEILAKQYEMARLDEANEGAVIQVLDVAMPPERKSAPRRSVIVLMGAILGFLLSAGYLVVKDLKKRTEVNKSNLQS